MQHCSLSFDFGMKFKNSCQWQSDSAVGLILQSSWSRPTAPCFHHVEVKEHSVSMSKYTDATGIFDKTNGICKLMIGSWFRTNSTSGWIGEVWPFDLWLVREAELPVWRESPLVDSQDTNALNRPYRHTRHNTQTLAGCWYNLQVNNGALGSQSVGNWAEEPHCRQNMEVVLGGRTCTALQWSEDSAPCLWHPSG